MENLKQGIAYISNSGRKPILHNSRFLQYDVGLFNKIKNGESIIQNNINSIVQDLLIDADPYLERKIKAIFENNALVIIASTIATGQNRIIKATQQLLNKPQFKENHISTAAHIFVNISYSDEFSKYEMKMSEQNSFMDLLGTVINDETETFIFNYSADKTLKGKVKITMIATGFFLNNTVTSSKVNENNLSWQIESLFGLKIDTKYLTADFVENLFKNADFKFYLDEQKKYLFSQKNELLEHDFGTLVEISALEAYYQFGIENLEKTKEKVYVKLS